MKTKKSILIISTEFPPAPGGIGSHAYALASELTQLGWKVVVASEQNNATQEEIDRFNSTNSFRTITLKPTPSVFSLAKKMLSLIILTFKEKPKYICGTGKHGAWFATLVAKLCFKNSVLIGHGTEFTVNMSARSKKINRYVYSHSNLLIAVSNYTKSIIERIGIINKNTVVIHNGANPNDYFVLENETIIQFKETKQISDQKILLTVGNLSPRKGQEWVIRALPIILKTFPNTHYYCIGIPSIEPELSQLSQELSVEKHVHFLGKTPTVEVNQWFNACDLFLMTSVNNEGDFEGFGISVIEAALCGKTAIVTNESGVIESIDDGNTGIGVPERDPLAISKNVLELIKNDAKRKGLETNALERARKYFVWLKVMKKYEEEILKL